MGAEEKEVVHYKHYQNRDMAKATTIVIEIRDSEGNVIAKKESLLWSTALENLYKLQRYVEKNEIPSELGKHTL